MSGALQVAADLDFEVVVPGRLPIHGTLRGSGNRLDLEVDDPGAFAGGEDAPAVRALAETLGRRGIGVRVWHAGTHLVTFGAVRAPWWQRRATGSRHIRLGSLRGAWTSARSRSRRTAPVLPDASLAPPTTLWPPAPTFLRRPRRTVTTTHDPARGGGPRLVLAVGEDVWPGERQPVYWLADGVSTIGSDPACDICLPRLASLQAEVHHDEADEFVIVARNPGVRVNGARAPRQVLRTGSRVEVGPWRLAYYREEYADHGRPYGGRIGGELGHQRPQPPRDAVR
ncbi:hypothetical protein GCM10009844_34170 [Nocardioides koreensis]|uniref:FHA domain-containing protein n=1 Tax=Nocardioides koreensis TaxID=433651 RepID=A0ABN3A136_9ACTN